MPTGKIAVAAIVITLASTSTHAIDLEGPEFRVNGPGAGGNPAVDMTPFGDFIVWWPGSVKRYTAAGIPTVEASGIVGGGIALDGSGGFYTLTTEHDPLTCCDDYIIIHVYDAAGQYQHKYSLDGVDVFPFELASAAVGGARAIWYNDDEGLLWNSFTQTVVTGGESYANNASGIDPVPYDGAIDIGMGDRFIIVWTGYWWPSGSPTALWGIFGRLFSESGTALTDRFVIKASEFQTTERIRYPSVAMDGNNSFLVVWERVTYDETDMDIHGQYFDADANPVGGEIVINQTTAGQQRYPDVAGDVAGNFYVVWQGPGEQSTDILARRVNSQAMLEEDEFIVNTTRPDIQSNPQISSEKHYRFIVAWKQSGPDAGVYAQRLEDKEQVPATVQSFESRWEIDHVAVRWQLIDVEGELAFDISRAQGPDGLLLPLAGAAVRPDGAGFVFDDYETRWNASYRYRIVILEDGIPVTSFETSVAIPAARFALDQNEPNPFNPSTSIRFSLQEDAHVLLVVYDVKGRKVATLVDEWMAAGTHVAAWNGRGDNNRPVATGTYFYRLTAGGRSLARRAVFLK